MTRILLGSLCATTLFLAPAHAGVIYNNLTPNGLIGVASRPDISATEIEAADDFLLTGDVFVNHASFVGLIVSGRLAPTISSVDVEIYRVFPQDSSNPPSGNVPTRANSPSDNAFD